MTASLDRIRDLVLENQRRGDDLPAARNRNVYVTRNGEIKTGDQLRPGEERRLSRAPQKVFASGRHFLPWPPSPSPTAFLPSNAAQLEVDGTTGWLYHFTCELGKPYTMFAYRDSSGYQVKVVSPEVEGLYGVHDAHLYADGTICFQDGGGLPTLEQAYAKSVLWATGFSLFEETDRFPFSRNNE